MVGKERNLVLLQNPAGADSLPAAGEMKKSGCMEDDVGVFVWEKGKVTMWLNLSTH